jgi:hypothetical protein
MRLADLEPDVKRNLQNTKQSATKSTEAFDLVRYNACNLLRSLFFHCYLPICERLEKDTFFTHCKIYLNHFTEY